MRLHSVRFKRGAYSKDEEYARSVIVRDLCTLYGCYLERCYDREFSGWQRTVWVARYA